jgi:hypothetical protein
MITTIALQILAMFKRVVLMFSRLPINVLNAQKIQIVLLMQSIII